jgi:hypothetical protein
MNERVGRIPTLMLYVFCDVLPKTEINFVVSNLLMIFRVGDDDMMKPTIVCDLHLNDRSHINCVASEPKHESLTDE